MLLIVIIINICISFANADSSQSQTASHNNQQAGWKESGVQLGVLIILGPDIRLFYQQQKSLWVFGIRYLDIKDDFVNESVVGFPDDKSDKLFTKTVGIYTDYVFNNQANSGSFYASGALYQTTKKLKCDSITDSDAATALYFGGGYQGTFSSHVGFKIGLLFSPFVNLKQNTDVCSNEESGDIDVDVGLTYKF